MTNDEPLVGAGASSWRPPELIGVVTDDLDPTFSIEVDNELEKPSFRLGNPLQDWNPEFDHGLPDYPQWQGQWARLPVPSSWGKYRHTMAWAAPGDVHTRAVFATDLPFAGRWRLQFHVPDRYVPAPDANSGLLGGRTSTLFGSLGNTDLKLIDGKRHTIEFYGRSATPGWNELGEFDLASRRVRLEVPNRTTGQLVLADAVRWIPVREVRPPPDVRAN